MSDWIIILNGEESCISYYNLERVQNSYIQQSTQMKRLIISVWVICNLIVSFTKNKRSEKKRFKIKYIDAMILFVYE
jgi:hypothetical protein